VTALPDGALSPAGLVNSTREIALRLLRIGFTPLYVEANSKAARNLGWQVERPSERSIDQKFSHPSNIGVRCGDLHQDGTCLIAIDVDVDDPDVLECVARAIGADVPRKRGKKGATFFVRGCYQQKTTKIKLLRGGVKIDAIDILARGAQTVIPPSTHPETGQPYKWIGGKPLWEINYQELPVFDETLIDEIRGFCANPDDLIYKLNTMQWAGVGGGGNTHDTCLSAIASMVARNWPDTTIHERIQRAKREACEAVGMEYHWPESQRIIQGWIESAKAKGFDQPKKKSKPSHGDLANLVLAKHGADIRRDKDLRDWYRYNGKFWEPGAIEGIKTLVRQCLTDDQVFRTVIDGVEAILRLYPEIVISNNDWDRDKHYLNCPEGTYNLKTRERMPHNPAHLITRITRISPRFDYHDSLWVKALETWFGGDPVEIEYIQMLFGLFLTGETKDECVAMWIGKSGAGKSKMTDIMSYIMGDYAQTATDTAFLDVRYHPHHEEVARMRGKRLVFIHEVEGYLNLRRVKSIASGEATSASFKGKDSFEFHPEAKLWFVGNEAPPSKSSGRELQRRFHVYEFVRQIEIKDMDRDLGAKLRNEADAILGWVIDGAVKYYAKGGIERSPHVIESSSHYFADADVLEQWIEDCCIVDAGAVSAVAELFTSHSFWADEARVKAILDKGRFSQRLKAKGYALERRTLFTGKPAVRAVVGLRLRTNDEMPLHGVVQEGEKF
jgi:putative DNA primase/helicase